MYMYMYVYVGISSATAKFMTTDWHVQHASIVHVYVIPYMYMYIKLWL